MNGWKYQYVVGSPPETRAERDVLVNQLDEMSEWCQTRLGDHWGCSGRGFYFMLEKDYTMFLLRWK